MSGIPRTFFSTPNTNMLVRRPSRSSNGLKVVDVSPHGRELPIEIWFEILLYLPDMQCRFRIAPVCWACELACLMLLKELMHEHPHLICFNQKLPRALRMQQRYLMNRSEEVFFFRRLLLDEMRYLRRDPLQERIVFHQTLLSPDARATCETSKQKLFAFLPNRGKSLRIVTAKHSNGEALRVWEDRKYFYDLDCGDKITALVKSQDILCAVGANRYVALFRESEHGFKYTKQASHQFSFQPHRAGLGENVALFSYYLNSGSGVACVDLETLQTDCNTRDLPSNVEVITQAPQNRFLLGLEDGSTVLFDGRTHKCTTMTPRRDYTLYPQQAPVNACTRHVFAFTNTSNGRLEVISSAKPQTKTILPKTLSSICGAVALDNFLLVGDALGATLWDGRSTKEPLSRLTTGFACPNLYLDCGKLVVASNWYDFAMGNYLCDNTRAFQSEFALKHMEFSMDENTTVASSHQDTVALLYVKQDRQDLICTTASTPPLDGDSAAQDTRIAFQIEKRRAYLEAQRLAKLAERKLQRDLTKQRASERWNRKT